MTTKERDTQFDLYCNLYPPNVGNKVIYNGNEGIVENITYAINVNGNKINVECLPQSKNFVNLTATETRIEYIKSGLTWKHYLC
jgi:hypothetical protein